MAEILQTGDGSFDIDPALVQGLVPVSGGVSQLIGNKRTLVMDLCDEDSDSDNSRYADSHRCQSISVTQDTERDGSQLTRTSTVTNTLEDVCNNSEKQKIYLTFNVWQAKDMDADDDDLATDMRSKKKTKKSKRKEQQSKKKKKATDQWTGYKSKRPITVEINLGAHNWESFKLRMLEACAIEKADVTMLLKEADALGELIFEGWINGSKTHKKSRHAEIKDDDSFSDYVVEAFIISHSNDIGFKVIHPDPKERKKNKDFDETLQKKKSRLENDKQLDSDSNTSEDDDDESDGSVELDPKEKKTKKLTTRFKEQWERGESIVQMANPKDPGEFLLLNTARIRLWASDWEDKVLGVDEVNPPMNRPGWKWIPAALVPEEKARLMGHTTAKISPSTPDPTHPTIVHNNYYNTPLNTPLGNFPAHLHLVNTPTGPSPPLLSGELSPPPGPSPSMHDLLSFTKIDRAKLSQTEEILSNAGVDRFEELLDRSAYSLDNLQEKVRLPYGHALIIFKAVPEFKKHLHRCFENQNQ
ncbi:hypothetical protein DFH28DRAFT_1071718 [Melampsora americana]|nr:hypothetical protein DFH28DRAFT_1071718 [Melampsora americana]